MIGRTIGHYRIVDRLGEGGMGVVYRAEDTKLGRSVALKFLPPEVSRDAEAKIRFEREARAASLLDHPNICTIYGFGEAEGGQLYIAMACYDGESLAARIAREVLTLDEAIRIVEQIGRGLGKAHASGIVHRDIKPANVMLTSEGVVKILDFGLAKLSGATGITRSHASLGTIVYMSPEQIRGEEVGPQADIWALGVVLFELLTGKRPFRGEYCEAISYAILNEQPGTITDLRPDLPAELDPIIKRMLRKDPLQRYQTVDEVLEDLAPLRTPSSGSEGRKRTTERQKLRSGAKLGPYVIEKPLGSGGMGDVYLAKDTRLERQVAIKVLPPEFSEDAQLKQRFQREAKTISQLSHPNICPLFDVGEQEGLDFLVMEYLEGETLADKKGPLPVPQVLKIGIQIAEALAAAHRQGIVHRDLKPGNVMITKSGTVKLVDFGLAKEVGAIATKTRGSEEKPLTDEGTIVGTLAYMAPEQIEGGEIDARADVFALGAMLYEMVTGKRAFEGKTKASLIVSILERDPIPITTLKPGESPVLVHVIDKCLAKDPDKRWQSALDIATELQWLKEAGRSALVQPNQRRRLARAALAALVVVTAALVAGSFLAGRATVRQPEAAAAAIPRLTQLTFLEGVEGQPSISPDGTAFVYVADTEKGNSDIFFQRVGGETTLNLTKESTEPDYHPAFSPDGQTIAYRSGAPSGVGGIYLMGATGESRRRLTDFGFNPAWSPDGKYLAVATTAIFDPINRPSTSELWRIDVASGEKKKIAAPGDAVQPSFSPNGRRIAYWGLPPRTGKRVLSTMPVEGGQAVALTDDNFFNWNPIWSPDGQYLYFASNRSGTMNLWRMRIDQESGASRGPAEPVTTAGQWNGQAAISRSGKLLYVATHASTSVVRFPLDSTTLRVGSPVSILGGTRDFWEAWPSPDGEWLALKGFDAQEDLFVAKADGSGLRRLTNDRYKDRGPAWSPDSAAVYFFTDRSGNYELWRISRDGSGLEQVTRTTGDRPTNPQVSRDGRHLLANYTNNPQTRAVGWHDLSRPLPFSEPEWIVPISPDLALNYLNVYGVWSPDSRHLVGTSRSKHSAFPGVYVYSLDEKNYEKLTDRGVPIGWLPDGRTILFVDRSTIFAINRVSRTIREVTSIPKGYNQNRLSISSDGRWIHMLKSDLAGDIWSLEFESPRSEATKSGDKR